MNSITHYRKGLSLWETHKFIISRLLIISGDMLCVACAYAFAYSLRFYNGAFLAHYPAYKGIPPVWDYVQASPIILFLWVLALSWTGAYRRINLPAIDEGLRVFRGFLVGTIMSMSAMFLYRDKSFSRIVFILGGAFSGILLISYRESLKTVYLFWARRNRHPRRVLVLGDGYLSASVLKILKRHGDRAVLKKNEIDLDDIKNTIRRSHIHEVLVANPNISHKVTVQLATFCEEKGVAFRLLPDILEIRMGEVLIDESLGIPTFQLKSVSLHGTAFLTKRVMDITLASLVIGVFSLPLGLIALIIRITSSGPIFYRQDRMGYKGRHFQFLKFRTMVQNADDLLEELKQKSDRGGPVFKMKEDPRITAIGKFLRRFSIDEIPQLINVLRGEMSLVGPRPQVIWEAQFYDDWAKKRLNVLPGITGLWQVSGRAELTYEEMIELDIYYIEHWSPGLDVKILTKTLPAVLSGKGAY